jgi:PLP dependent protein
MIGRSARRAGRAPETIKLLAVTKGHPLDILEGAYSIGLREFGENYVEEAVGKIEYFKQGEEISWHMIGHLQSRKTRQVCELFTWFQALDRMKIANRLAVNCQETGRELPVLLECNVSGEDTKFGWPAWDETAWDNLVTEFNRLVQLPGIQVKGLMTMAPFDVNPEKSRPYFTRLRKLRDFLSQKVPAVDWKELSMGMSADYPVAIEEGATIVRIGTALFGYR